MAHLETASQVIDALGGTRRAARRIDRITEQAVSKWRSKNKIPACYVDLIRDLLLPDTADNKVFKIISTEQPDRAAL